MSFETDFRETVEHFCALHDKPSPASSSKVEWAFVNLIATIQKAEKITKALVLKAESIDAFPEHDALNTLIPQIEEGFIPSRELYKFLKNLDCDTRFQTQVAKVMRNLGWVSTNRSVLGRSTRGFARGDFHSQIWFAGVSNTTGLMMMWAANKHNILDVQKEIYENQKAYDRYLAEKQEAGSYVA
jgi:hypothetical protein